MPRTGQIYPLDEANRRLLARVHPPAWQNPTPCGRYNLVVIGGGTAGLVTAAGAAGLGAKVALIERHLLGGDCLNVGCVPSKSLIRVAKLLGEVRRAADFGVTVSAPQVDFRAVMARMREVRAGISEHDSAQRFQELGVDVYLGDAHFSGSESVTVVNGGEAQTLHFAKAVIATGSRTSIPAIPGLAEAGYLTNETVFELEALPRRLAILGGGPIGVELAQVFQRFGSEVTLIAHGPRLMSRDDEEAAALLMQILRREGVQVMTQAQVTQVRRTEGTYLLDVHNPSIKHGSGQEANPPVTVDAILVATGRTPNVETLNLAAANITLQEGALAVNDHLQTSNPNIFAAGDVAFAYRFTHAADATARIVVQNALFPLKKKSSDLVIPWCTYTDPEVAQVGLLPSGAAAQGIQIDTFIQPIAATDRGRTDGDVEGFAKIHVKRGSDKIVGATIVARHAGEMISEVTTAMVNGVGLKGLATVIHPYPTQAEAIRKIADAYNRKRLTPAVQRVFRWWLARSR